MGTDKEKLILGYFRNELSDLEKSKLESLMDENPAYRDEVELLEKVWKTPTRFPGIVNMEDEQKKIWDRLQNENDYSLNPKENKFLLTWNTFKYAAAIILLLGLGYIFWESNQPVPDKAFVTTKTIERANPLGQKSRIQLPDGSNVWLNAGSKLTYTNDFGQSKRKLKLKGEAYFQVTEDATRPFEVYTDNLVVTALGTSFNVCAFEDQQIEKVALNTGKVKVEFLGNSEAVTKPSYLEPGNLASFDIRSKKIDLSHYAGLDPFGWKDGRIVFNNATFKEVTEVLSRWYNVKFEVSGTLDQEWHYKTTFENEILVNVLESLKFSESIEYELVGSSVKIKL